MEIIGASRMRWDGFSRLFFDDRIYEKMKDVETGFFPEDVVKYALPNPIVPTFAWTARTLAGPFQVMTGIRLSLLYKVTRILPVTISSLTQGNISSNIEAQRTIITSSVQRPSVTSLPNIPVNADSSLPSVQPPVPILTSSATPVSSSLSVPARQALCPNVIDYYHKTVRELRLHSRDLHLPCTGTKDAIVSRLVDYDRMRAIENVAKVPHEIGIELAKHFANELLRALRSEQLVPDSDTSSVLGFPCRHLYDHELDLPSLMNLNPSGMRTSHMQLKEADAILATVAVCGGLATCMYRVGCVDIKTPAEDTSPSKNHALYFPFPVLPSTRILPELFKISPVVQGDRLLPVMNITDTLNNLNNPVSFRNSKGDVTIPLERVHWAVALPRVRGHEATCLPSFLPMQDISPREETVNNQGFIPEALMYECYVRQSEKDTSALRPAKIFFQCCLLIEIPGYGSEARQTIIHQLADWVSSPEKINATIDAVRVGSIREREETFAAHKFQLDLHKYSWLDVHIAQGVARQFHLDDSGSARSILHRVHEYLAGKTSLATTSYSHPSK